MRLLLGPARGRSFLKPRVTSIDKRINFSYLSLDACFQKKGLPFFQLQPVADTPACLAKDH
jgi:hypothetical protein